jgi:D-serine deaminase-like pyridoxal phosphate-dependent protein
MSLREALANLETPCLLLDRDRLQSNLTRFQAIADSHNVTLRPHLKTLKSVEAAHMAVGSDGAITVSTLAEAEVFAAAGYRDILYGVGMAPNKLARLHRIQQESGARILLVSDSTVMAEAAGAFAEAHGAHFHFLLEVDCGDKRGGLPADSPHLLSVAGALKAGGATVAGVLSHAGHSYGASERAQVEVIAEEERASAVLAADCLRAEGYDAGIVSIGSTPTVAYATDLTGVTEVRAGVYMPFDLDQMSRGLCGHDDLALSVLTTVIGHNREAMRILVDAGGLALSKDISAQAFMPGAGYGLVADAETLAPLDGLVVNTASQEHGKIDVADTAWFERLPVGAQVRILPNHACFTAAAYPGYQLLENGALGGRWSRVNGW